VFVLGKQRDNFPLLSEPLKTDVNKNVVMERFLNWNLAINWCVEPVVEGLIDDAFIAS